LDINFKGTGVTPSSEKLIKEIIKDKVFRGKVEVIFNLFERDPQKWNIQFNEYLLEDILDRVLSFNSKYKKNVSISLDNLLKIPMVFHIDYIFDRFQDGNVDDFRNAVEQVFNEFLESREQEGNFIQEDLLKSLDIIEEKLALVKDEADKIENEIYENFREKIQRFLKEIEVDEKRVAQEAALSAERSCITEEINRLSTHTQRMRKLLLDESNPLKGKESDFLSQEMQRETHTIASKTNSMEIHRMVILVRREIEKIKQQVQNVE
jgi:uncharacterized protein (TIGR00255 family)